MYRVELKAALVSSSHSLSKSSVPNVPCGVERLMCCWIKPRSSKVPNVPCGVERPTAHPPTYPPFATFVPNVPCGVESNQLNSVSFTHNLNLVPNVPCGVESCNTTFLSSLLTSIFLFLMYRVELKVRTQPSALTGGSKVPNVPCGVERLTML